MKVSSLCAQLHFFILLIINHCTFIREGRTRRLEGGVSACLYVTKVITSKAIITFSSKLSGDDDDDDDECNDRFEILPEQ